MTELNSLHHSGVSDQVSELVITTWFHNSQLILLQMILMNMLTWTVFLPQWRLLLQVNMNRARTRNSNERQLPTSPSSRTLDLKSKSSWSRQVV